MNWLFLGLFIISSTVHLFASAKQNKPLRNVSKPLLLITLLAYYCLSVQNPSWLVVSAVMLSWLGDVLLIPHGNKWFTAGGISFMASHVLFILSYCEKYPVFNNPWYIYVIFGVVYTTLVVFIFSKLKPHLPKPLFYPMALYLLINGAMNSFAIFSVFGGANASTIVTMIGAICFFVSDSTLFFVRFKKDCRIRTHFAVMLTYILAEFLIVLGFIL